MGAAERDNGRNAHPAVNAVLLLVAGVILSLFPIALYANAMALADGYRASRGQAGVPGIATVESAVESRGGQVCRGTFVPDEGAPVADVRIEVSARCEEGQETATRLMEGRPSPFTGYDEPRAWAAGANDWGTFVPLVVLFGLLSLPAALVVVMLLAKLCKLVLTGGSGGLTGRSPPGPDVAASS